MELLEQIRLLTNLETTKSKLLQIIMIGQPELRDILSRPELRQISQRITARYHIGPLSRKEVVFYVNHRLTIAGAREKLFPDYISKSIYQYSHGIPRLINVICDRALLGTYVQGKKYVDKSTLKKATMEVSGDIKTRGYNRKTLKWILTIFLLFLSASAIFGSYFRYREDIVKNKTILSGVKTSEETTYKPFNWMIIDEEIIKKYVDTTYQANTRQWNIPYQRQKQYAVCDFNQVNGLLCVTPDGVIYTRCSQKIRERTKTWCRA